MSGPGRVVVALAIDLSRVMLGCVVGGSSEMLLWDADEGTDDAGPSSGSRARTRVHCVLRPGVGMGDSPIWCPGRSRT